MISAFPHFRPNPGCGIDPRDGARVVVTATDVSSDVELRSTFGQRLTNANLHYFNDFSIVLLINLGYVLLIEVDFRGSLGPNLNTCQNLADLAL